MGTRQAWTRVRLGGGCSSSCLMPPSFVILLLLLATMSVAQQAPSATVHVEVVAALRGKTFSGAATLDAAGNHLGPHVRDNPQRCAAICAQHQHQQQAPCTAFSFCPNSGGCDLLVGTTLTAAVSGQLAAGPGCDIYNATEGPAAASAAAMGTTTLGASSSGSTAATTTTTTTTTMTMTTTAAPTTSPAGPAARSATASIGTLFIPTLFNSTYGEAVAACKAAQARVVDIITNATEAEICSILHNQMNLTTGSRIWIHAYASAGTSGSCGGGGKRFQLVVGASNNTCSSAQWMTETVANALALCWGTVPAVRTFTLSNATTSYNFAINLRYTMNFSEASQWCSQQVATPYLVRYDYNNAAWKSAIDGYFASDVPSYPCNMHFWVKPVVSPSAPNCTRLTYISMSPNDAVASTMYYADSPLCASDDKFAFCSSAPN